MQVSGDGEEVWLKKPQSDNTATSNPSLFFWEMREESMVENLIQLVLSEVERFCDVICLLFQLWVKL